MLIVLNFYHPHTDPPINNSLINNTFTNNTQNCVRRAAAPIQYYKNYTPCKDYWVNNTVDKPLQLESEKTFCFPVIIILMVFSLFLIRSK